MATKKTAKKKPVIELIESDDDQRDYRYWCPGCEVFHIVTTRRFSDPALSVDPDLPENNLWRFCVEGDEFKPTIKPTVNIRFKPDPDSWYFCHHLVTPSHGKGHIYFFPESSHELAGQTVPMVPIEEAG